MKRLGVNIDHVATLRNARRELHPSPIKAAKLAIKYGASSITIHLREDRRHIKDNDLAKISKIKKIPVNLEIAATNKMMKIAIKHKPEFIIAVKLKDTKLFEGIGDSKKKAEQNAAKKLLNNLNI